MYARVFHRSLGLLLTASVLAVAGGQPVSDPIVIKAIAEVEQTSLSQGRETTKMVPAERVVSGDLVMYTLEVRNTAQDSVPKPIVTYPVPEHMIYAPDSAVGPGTEVTYSVDAGRSFDSPENLKIQEPGGLVRPATSVDYTHIRWQLKNALKGNSAAFLRFRARVK
jgi:uncharacterized repeat protein (TIGR01451 family)